MGQKKEYLSLTEIIRECEESGIRVLLNSLKWRIDNGKIPSIRDQNDIRKRRIVPSEELPNIISYFTELSDVRKGKYYPLSKLAKDIGLKEKSLYKRANKLGIESIKVGNSRLLEKSEYYKWRLILSRKKQKKQDYFSPEFIGRQFGVSKYLIIYRIKRREIPAIKIDNKYCISKKDFEKHGEEWREQCGYNHS